MTPKDVHMSSSSEDSDFSITSQDYNIINGDELNSDDNCEDIWVIKHPEEMRDIMIKEQASHQILPREPTEKNTYEVKEDINKLLQEAYLPSKNSMSKQELNKEINNLLLPLDQGLPLDILPNCKYKDSPTPPTITKFDDEYMELTDSEDLETGYSSVKQ